MIGLFTAIGFSLLYLLLMKKYPAKVTKTMIYMFVLFMVLMIVFSMKESKLVKGNILKARQLQEFGYLCIILLIIYLVTVSCYKKRLGLT
jgi:hypothetical protein